MKLKLFFFTLLLSVIMGKGFLFSQNMMHFTSDEFKYSVQIPEDWKRADDVSEKVALVMLSEEGSSMSIAFYQLNGLSSEDFIENYEKSLGGNLEELEMEEKGVIMSRDADVIYLVYVYDKEGHTIREKVCFYTRDGEMALVLVNNSEDAFQKDIAIFNKIFKSFTFETIQNKVEAVEGED